MVVFPFPLSQGHHAAVGDFAFGVFELDGGVVDSKVFVQAIFHIFENAFAGRGGDVGDGDVAGEGAGFRSDAPDVQVVHVVDAFDFANGAFHVFDLETARRTFEQNVQRLAHDAEAGPQDQDADSDGERGIDPVLAGGEDGPAAGDDGGSLEGVADLVEESAADVDVASGAIEQERDDAVHDDAGGGHGDHHSRMDLLRAANSAHRLIKNKERYAHQRQRVDQGGEHTGAMVAVGLGGARRPRLQINRGEGKQERKEVGKVMSGFRQQRQGMGSDAGDHQQYDIGQGDEQGNAQNLGRPLVPAVHVRVHVSSLRASRAGIKVENSRKASGLARSS